MHEQELLRQIVDTVPHWYLADHGPVEHVLAVGGQELAFKSHSACTEDLAAVFDFIDDHAEDWAASLPEVVTIRDLSNVRREVVIAWLRLHDDEVEWERLFAWADNLEFRTSENRPVTLNLILSPGSGGTDITEVSLQKGLDSIATSGQVLLEVDKQLCFLDYRQITREDICQLPTPAFNPEFLDPFVAVLSAGQWSFHITEMGDTIVLDRGGLVASCRKGRWTVWDRAALTAAASSIFGGVDIAANTLLCALDLSYRRKGALLVFDPDRLVVDHLVECACRLADPSRPPSGIHALLGPRASSIRMGATMESEHQRKLLLELATLDGAVLFDRSSVLAFGGILHMHDSARGHLGARTTAAYSAYQWGGVPVMISADGEMTIVFTSRDPRTGDEGPAALTLL